MNTPSFTIKSKYNSFPKQVKASFWFLICSFLQKGISVITTPIFTRIMNPGEYGAYSAFDSWYNIVAIFVTLNLSAGVYMQGLVKFESNKERFSSSLQGLTFVLVLIWTCIYLSFHSFWNSVFELTTVQMLCMLAMMWASASFNFWAVDNRVSLNYVKLVLVTLFVSVAKPLIGIILVVNSDDKVTARIVGLALVELIGYSFCFIFHLYKGRVLFDKKIWLYALSFNLPLIPHYLSQTILNSSDRIMIQRLLGESDAGLYSLAYSVSRIMMLLNSAILATLSPWIYQKIRDRKENEIASVAYSSLLIVGITNILVIAFAPELVRIFAPDTYYESIFVIPPVALSVFYNFAYNIFAAFEFYYKKSTWIAFASVVGAVLNVVLNYLFIPRFGYIAAGYTTLVCFIVYALMHYIFMNAVCKKYLNNSKVYDGKMLLLLSSSLTIVGLSIGFTYNSFLIRLMIIIFIVIIALINKQRIVKLAKQLLNKSGVKSYE